MAAGDPLGDEWAYITPRFPEGIRRGRLGRHGSEIQIETASVWFVANLEPYNTDGRPYFGFGYGQGGGYGQSGGYGAARGAGGFNTSALNTAAFNGTPGPPRSDQAGFGQGEWSPAPIESYVVLTGEFGDVLPESVISDLVTRFPGEWMWRTTPALTPIDLVSGHPSWGDLQANILVHLEAIRELVERQPPAHGGIGHNQSDAECLQPEDKELLLAAVRRAKAAVASRTDDSASNLLEADQRFAEVGNRLGRWLLGKTDVFATKYVETLGQEAAKWTVRGLTVWLLIQSLSPLLKLASQLASMP